MDAVLYETLADGSCRQWHPLHGLQVLSVPGRTGRPMSHGHAAPAAARSSCDFCPGHEPHTPPERGRVAAEGGWSLRRFGNLFEMVSWEYWKLNHGSLPRARELAWRDAVLSDPAGRAQVLERAAYKLRRSYGEEALSETRLLEAAEAFFFGGHEVACGAAHCSPDGRAAGSADLSPAGHAAYLAFSFQACAETLERLPAARHVVLFQNWLAGAGASFEHLHKQLMATDAWGPALERAVGLASREPHLWQRLAADFSRQRGLALAENAHALAVVEPGQQWPTVAIYAKASLGRRPWELGPEALAGLSQLLWACHAALGSETPNNEEWIWTPRGCKVALPIQARLKARLFAPGGFEGATSCFINPYHPAQWHAQMLASLKGLKAQGGLDGLRLGQDCPCEAEL